ncbi:hypothetical protein N656DRAFT_777165 [Canariomyces notabilis]|uniref:Uncharacterized protein n=1 Tax=Canariomyces notabilis TaxID=2074819 RepID=A0AAN6THM1_9PEZI|nr:hypothetical protein N656DRAFT_777165 [Canariomyces arenarius]
MYAVARDRDDKCTSVCGYSTSTPLSRQIGCVGKQKVPIGGQSRAMQLCDRKSYVQPGYAVNSGLLRLVFSV